MNKKFLIAGAFAEPSLAPLAAQKTAAAADLPHVVNVKALDCKFDARRSVGYDGPSACRTAGKSSAPPLRMVKTFQKAAPHDSHRMENRGARR